MTLKGALCGVWGGRRFESEEKDIKFFVQT